MLLCSLDSLSDDPQVDVQQISLCSLLACSVYRRRNEQVNQNFLISSFFSGNIERCSSIVITTIEIATSFNQHRCNCQMP